MTTTTVSIGRDCARHPLDDARWQDFCDRTVDALEQARLTVVFAGQGTGFWQPEAGAPVVTEESFTVVALGEPPRLLRALFADLADRFGQEAIAVTVGQTDLVEAAPLFQAVEA